MFPNSDTGARGPPQQPGVPSTAAQPGNAGGFRGPPGNLPFGGPPVNNPGIRGPPGNAAIPGPPSNPGSFGGSSSNQAFGGPPSSNPGSFSGPPSNQAFGGPPSSNPAFGSFPPSNPPFGGPPGNPALRGPPTTTNQGFAGPPPAGRPAGPPTGPPPGGPPSFAGPSYPRPAFQLATPSSMAQSQGSQPPPYNAIAPGQQQQQQPSQSSQFPGPPPPPFATSGAFPPSTGTRGPFPGAPPGQPGSGPPPPPLRGSSGPLPYGQGPVPLSTQFQNMNLASQGQSGVRAPPPPVFGPPGGQGVPLGPPQRIYPDAAAVTGPLAGGVPPQAPGIPNQYARGPPHIPPTMGHIPGVVEKYGPGVPGMPQPVSPTTPNPASGTSRIDPNQIPRPLPGASFVEFETRVNGQANLPPSATVDFRVKDTGNCSPRLMRSTLNQIPCTGDLLSTSGMPLAVMVQPFALPNRTEEPIQVVDFGESGPVRCSRCKGYINPFMKFIDQGRRFVCNLCGFTNETPRDYHCNLGPDGRRRDIDQRPELSKGTVEFVASKEYLVRPPMPPVYFFLVDVSLSAIQSGAVVAACSAIKLALKDLPEGPRTMVGIATFDSTIHFYALNKNLQQAAMLVVPDIQDVYTPLQSDLIVPLSEVGEHLKQLLDSIPSMFQNNRVPEAAFGAAIKGAFLAMKSTGGKLLVFQSVLPSVGIGALTPRQSEGRLGGEKEYLKLMQAGDKTLKTMAIEFAEFQVCVELFIMSQNYVDITTISAVPRTTGGQVYYYNPFSAKADSAKLYNDLRWNVTRAQGLEAVMRVRCSQGLQVEEYYGNFCKRIPTDVDLPAIDCDKTIMVTFKHDDKFQEGAECCFQCALLYTTITGDRRIRVITLSLSCTSVLSNLFRGADLDAQFTYLLKHAAQEVPSLPLSQVREQITSQCVNILYTYRKFCATASSSGQLILPEALKLLPLYTLALAKSIGLRFDSRSDNQVDERAYWLTRVSSLSASLAIPVVYPRMFAIHKLPSQEALGGAILPPVVPLSSEHLDQDGIFLLETGEDAYIYVGKQASPELVHQLFGVNSVDEILSGQFELPVFENESSKRLNAIVNEIRGQRYSYLRLRLLRRGDPLEFVFFSFLVEDKSSAGLSYVEFLVHVHRQIQNRMT